MPGTSLGIRLANRLERLRQLAWRLAAHESEERHIVIGGAPRSGTTLLRRLLDRHPAIRAGPETKLFVPAAFNLEWLAQAYAIPIAELRQMRRESPSQGAFIDAFARRVKKESRKRRWAEKTPMNIRYLDWIAPRFPRASLVHIIRDGRDVVCSMREHPDWRWKGGGWEKVLVPRPLEAHARRWLADTAAGLRWRGRPGYVELRYEDVVADPAGSLGRLAAAIGEEAGEAWLREVGRTEPGDGARARPDDKGAISAASIGRWRSDLTESERQLVERLCGPRLRELGYEA